MTTLAASLPDMFTPLEIELGDRFFGGRDGMVDMLRPHRYALVRELLQLHQPQPTPTNPNPTHD